MPMAVGTSRALGQLSRPFRRRMPIGAELQPGGGAHFRVWAPKARQVEVVLGAEAVDQACADAPAVRAEVEGNGYYSAYVPDVRAGTRYLYRLDAEACYPDPASRFQPEGPHGPSEVIDPDGFHWTDRAWKGAGLEG